MVGKYERGDASPSIEMAKKSRCFEVSLDSLVGDGQNITFNKKIMEIIEDIQNLDNDTQHIFFNLIDTYI